MNADFFGAWRRDLHTQLIRPADQDCCLRRCFPRTAQLANENATGAAIDADHVALPEGLIADRDFGAIDQDCRSADDGRDAQPRATTAA